MIASKPIVADSYEGKTCSKCRMWDKCPDPEKGTIWCYGYRAIRRITLPTITEVAIKPCKLCGFEMHGGPMHDPDTLRSEVRRGVCNSCYALDVAAGDTF